MISGEVAVGAMNLYAHMLDGFSNDDEAVGIDLLRDRCCRTSRAYWTAFDLSQNLSTGLGLMEALS